MRRLTMSRHRRRAASTPEAAKSDQMCHPPMKVSTRSRKARRAAFAQTFAASLEGRRRRRIIVGAMA